MSRTLHIHAPLVTVRSAADGSSEPSNELLYGEAVEVLGGNGAWTHIRSTHDGYEGYVEQALLSEHLEKQAKISAPVTHLYEQPDFKTTPRHALYFGSPVCVTDEKDNGFVRLANKGWVFEGHLVAIDHIAPDFVETALLFKHAPYIWGGRSAAGIDCSGLVQIALMAAGIPCPRDTKDQEARIGEAISSDIESLKRGDLVYFKRHVGIMIDEREILNATSRHMSTALENVADLAQIYGGITHVRRIS